MPFIYDVAFKILRDILLLYIFWLKEWKVLFVVRLKIGFYAYFMINMSFQAVGNIVQHRGAIMLENISTKPFRYAVSL